MKAFVIPTSLRTLEAGKTSGCCLELNKGREWLTHCHCIYWYWDRKINYPWGPSFLRAQTWALLFRWCYALTFLPFNHQIIGVSVPCYTLFLLSLYRQYPDVISKYSTPSCYLTSQPGMANQMFRVIKLSHLSDGLFPFCPLAYFLFPNKRPYTRPTNSTLVAQNLECVTVPGQPASTSPKCHLYFSQSPVNLTWL